MRTYVSPCIRWLNVFSVAQSTAFEWDRGRSVNDVWRIVFARGKAGKEEGRREKKSHVADLQSGRPLEIFCFEAHLLDNGQGQWRKLFPKQWRRNLFWRQCFCFSNLLVYTISLQQGICKPEWRKMLIRCQSRRNKSFHRLNRSVNSIMNLDIQHSTHIISMTVICEDLEREGCLSHQLKFVYKCIYFLFVQYVRVCLCFSSKISSISFFGINCFLSCCTNLYLSKGRGFGLNSL